MENRIEFQTQVTLEKDLNSCFFLLSDLSHLKEWDPSVEKVKKISTGSVAKGSQWNVILYFFNSPISILYEVVDFHPNEKVFFRGETENVSITTQFQFEPRSSQKTILTVESRYELRGVLLQWKSLLEPFLQKMNRDAYEHLRTALSSSSESFENAISPLFYPSLLPLVYDFSRFGFRSTQNSWKAVTTNLSGRTALVTGGSSGIGLELAISLARSQARVVIVGQNREKLKRALVAIRELTGNSEVYAESADLSLCSENLRIAQLFRQKWGTLSILVNNVGTLFPERLVTEEGFEKSIALLLYGPLVLTEQLYGLLVHQKDARVINVSTGGIYAEKIHTGDLNSTGSYRGEIAYARAKRGLVHLSNYWSEKWKKSGVKSFATHPGWADTESVRNTLPVFYRLTRSILRTPEEGARGIFWLCASEELKNQTGGFWFDRKLHPEHIFPNTKNSPEELDSFFQQLQEVRSRFLSDRLF